MLDFVLSARHLPTPRTTSGQPCSRRPASASTSPTTWPWPRGRRGRAGTTPQVAPYGPIQLDPAAAVLHYAQEIFEGLKAYRHADGSVWPFRPDQNAARFAALRRAGSRCPSCPPRTSSRRRAPWSPPTSTGCRPAAEEASLYLRPFMFASEAFLGVRPAAEVTFCVIASPAGPYFAGGVKPVSIWLSRRLQPRRARAAPAPPSAAATTPPASPPRSRRSAHGCDQVCFLDAVEHRWVEELGGMNLYFVIDDGTSPRPSSPAPSSRASPATRSSRCATTCGHEVERAPDHHRRVARRRGVRAIREVFACGTAAVVTPVGRLVWDDGESRRRRRRHRRGHLGRPRRAARRPVRPRDRRARVAAPAGVGAQMVLQQTIDEAPTRGA